MSLMRIALRIAAIEALRGKTFVNNNVLDSEIGAIDIAADHSVDSDRGEPFISVYTAEAVAQNDGRISLFGATNCDLVLDAAVSAQMVKRDDDGDIVSNLPITPDSDRAYEISLDVLQHQIYAAFGEPEGEWAEIVRKIISDKINAVEISVGRSSSKARLAARQIRITIELCPDPVNLDDLSSQHPFSMFLNELEKGDADDAERDEDFKGLAAALRGVIASNHTGWKLDQFRYGLHRDELDSLLVTPGDGVNEDTVITESAFDAMVG